MKTLTKDEVMDRLEVGTQYATEVSNNGINKWYHFMWGEHLLEILEDEDENKKIESLWCEQLAPDSIDCEIWMQEATDKEIEMFKQMLADGELYLCNIDFENGDELKIIVC